jgi:hypothetical protein
MTDEWTGEKSTSGRVRNSRCQTGMSAEREVKRSRRRKGVKATPNTSSSSPRSIRAAQRRAEALNLRVQGYTFEVIGKHLGVSKAQAARDIDAALAEITTEPAKQLLAMELRRLDELQSAHFHNATEGDPTATNAVLRIMAHRAMLLGWSRDQQGAARVVISDGGGPGGEPRKLELEFVLPGGGHVAMDDALGSPDTQYRTHRANIDTPVSPPSSPPLRIKPEPTDLVLDKVQPSAWKKPRGGFDWS